MRRHLIIMLLAVVGLSLGTNGFTQEKKGPGVNVSTIKTAEDRQINAFPVEKIIGSKVINLRGETLGKIENLVVDVDTGRIVYAILESDGFLDIGDKLFPVPWESLAALPAEGIFFLNQSKEQMVKAPAFDKNKPPNMGDMRWGADVLKYYGVTYGHKQGGPFGYDYSYFADEDDYGARNPQSSGAEINPAPQIEDPYQKIFDSQTIETISGKLVKIDQLPEFGFGLQMRLTVYVDKKEILPVYLGPAYYLVRPWQAKHLKLGDDVTVRGSLVKVKDEALMIAVSVKRGDTVLRLRDQEGNPEWFGWSKVRD